MTRSYDVLIVGGGAGGIAAAASILKRRRDLEIGIIEPGDVHKYQPGWTLVGGGVFRPEQVVRPMRAVMPRGVSWIQEAVSGFDPGRALVRLNDGSQLAYRALVAAPGIKLDWAAVEGLPETLGRNGVTSNYALEHAPYTWELVQGLRRGRAVFTQPPMPIKCAGAPQKAMYLSCFEWEQQGCLNDMDVSFHNAGGALFGVADYVPVLEGYVARYGASLDFNENLVAVDGGAQKAWFDTPAGRREVAFDLLHVCPPQTAPDFVRDSDLAGPDGWIDVADDTLAHRRFDNVYALGDACSTPNAKTAAAVRKQAPVIAENVLAGLAGRAPVAAYDGYGSCPLTVERGRVVLAEFGYGGKLLPTAPAWLNDGTRPTRLAWLLKARLLPPIYFELMLKGREWFAAPEKLEGNADVAALPR